MITQTLARIVDAADRDVSSVSVAAPLSHGQAVLAVTWAGMDLETAEQATVMVWAKPDDHVAILPPLTAPEQAVIDAAWQWGAWDILRTCIGPGYAGSLPPFCAPIAAQARTQGYACWTWRPMLRGPDVRIKAHGAKDITLQPLLLGRCGPAPDLRIPQLRPNTQRVLRLGKSPQPERRGRVPPATSRQIAMLHALRRKREITDPLPPLDIRSASEMIKALLAAPERRS